LREGISQIRLRQGNDVTDPSNDVIGTLNYDVSDVSRLIVNIDTDTLPIDTQGTVNNVINPQNNYPNDGTLPVVAAGQRYLVLDSTPDDSLWGNVTASANDIIKYNGSAWVVEFDASVNAGANYVTNLHNGVQFEWTGEFWQNSYEGTYKEGWFRLYV
jgi:hypothetical protein